MTSFPLPHPRGFRTKDNNRKCSKRLSSNDNEIFEINDVILHVLIARLTGSNNVVHEFETMYDPERKLIEIDVPDCFMDFLETVEVGPNICRYMRWLVCLGLDNIADNLVWISENDLAIITAGKKFNTPNRFYPNTFAVFVNGKKVDAAASDGFDVIDDRTFEMKQSHVDDCISVAYMKK